jgi:HlyD family secretion protein
MDPEAQVNNNVTQFNVRVEIDNSTPTFRLLKPGMNATCDFNVAEKDNVLSVPNQAVQTDDQGTFVLVAKGGQPAPSDASDPSQGVAPMLVGVRVEKRAVQIGVQGDDLTEITSGLKAGEKVVTAVLSSTPSPTSTSQKSAFGGGGGPGGGPGGPP